MADMKISAMTGASEVGNADDIPIVAGGANFKATRDQLLSAATGEHIFVTGVAGFTAGLQDSTTNNQINVSGSVGIMSCDTSIVTGGPTRTTGIECDALDNINITLKDLATLFISDVGGNNFIIMDTNTGTLNIQMNTGMDGSITNLVAGNWAGTPGQLSDSFNRLAAAVAGLLGTPIP